MQSTLYQLYLHTSRKYRKFSARLKKSISTGKFYNQTRYEQNKILKRVKKLRTRLQSLYLQLKIAGFTGLLLAGINSVETKAQGLGPFTNVNRILNPLRPPIQMYSEYAAAPAFADIDGDGDIDMLIGIYDGGSSTITYKNFQVDYGLSKPAFKLVPNAALPYTVYSIYGTWHVSFIDLDGDGIEELAVSPRYYDPVEFLKNKNDGSGDFYLINPGIYIGPDYYSTSLVSADVDNDGDLDIFSGSAETEGLYFWKNDGTNNFSLTTHGLPSYAPAGFYATPAFFDIDNDGDLDLFTGEKNGTVQFFLNQESGGANINPDNFILDNANPLNFLKGIDFGDFAIPRFVDLDMDGDKDLVVGHKGFQNAPAYEGTNFSVFYNDGNIFTQATRLANPFGGVDVGDIADPTWGDIDGDGDIDLFIGSQNNGVLFYEQNNIGFGDYFLSKTGAQNPLNIVGTPNNTSPALADMDNDGDLDDYVGTSTSLQYH